MLRVRLRFALDPLRFAARKLVFDAPKGAALRSIDDDHHRSGELLEFCSQRAFDTCARSRHNRPRAR